MKKLKRSVAVQSESTSAAQMRRHALALSVSAAFALPQIAYAQAVLPQGWQPTSGSTATPVYTGTTLSINQLSTRAVFSSPMTLRP